MHGEVLDEAYQRFHATGPEFGGESWLTNHGPMAAEVLARRGHADAVPGWVDRYLRRLDELPPARDPITDETWLEALGDPRRVGDWIAYLTRQVQERPWREVLVTWWPRLLPGILAGATHGVIRVGHATRTLLAGDESAPAVTELAHGLAYWAARAQRVPAVSDPNGTLDPAAALAAVPPIPDQNGKVAERMAQLKGLDGWTDSLAALRPPVNLADARDRLADVVAAGTLQYLRRGHGSPVLLVHAATAPNAILHTLPALPDDLYGPSLAAGWAASAAITAAYAPEPVDVQVKPPADEADLIERAASNGDEHVIKFADTAAEVHQRTGNPAALAAAVRATELINPGR